jgi:hypothetical protein
MIEEATPRKNAEFTRGRPFAKGNGGRPKGSRNRTTVVAQALLAGEETEILRKAIEVAKAGDVQMLKFFLDRLLPRERLIKIDIPRLDFANDAVEAMMVISEMVANGQITPSEAASIASLIAGYARTIEITDLSNRVDALEASLEPKE